MIFAVTLQSFLGSNGKCLRCIALPYFAVIHQGVVSLGQKRCSHRKITFLKLVSSLHRRQVALQKIFIQMHNTLHPLIKPVFALGQKN